MGCHSSKEAAPKNVCSAEEGDVLVIDLTTFVQTVHHDPSALNFCHCSFRDGKDETELLISRADLGLPLLTEEERKSIVAVSLHDNKRKTLESKLATEASQKPKRLAKVKMGKNQNETRCAMGNWRKTEVTILEEIRGEVA